MYADDIIHKSKSQKFMPRIVKREINEINNYKKKWEVKTNFGKFKIISLAVRKTPPVKVNGTKFLYPNESMFLRLHFSKGGIVNHN